MKKTPTMSSRELETNSTAPRSIRFWPSSGMAICRTIRSAVAIMALICMSTLAGIAQAAAPKQSDEVTIRGTVVDSTGKVVGDAVVRLEHEGRRLAAETKTNAAGKFSFPSLGAGSYIVTAEKSGLHSRSVAVLASPAEEQKQVELVLSGSTEDSGTVPKNSGASSPPSAQVMEFADKPNFTVAGVTDWTAVGGHGSDSSLRASEDLTRETLTLKSEDPGHIPAGPTAGGEGNESESKLRAALAHAPGSFEANHELGEFYLHAGRYRESIPLLQSCLQLDPANHANEFDLAIALMDAGDLTLAREHAQKLLAIKESAELHRLAGELDEKLGDPLAAVHEFEQAVRLSPSEENYFEWGSELLLHRAVWQALEVFQNGVKAYPNSARMMTALGTALFAVARYDEAALRLCDASELNPTDTAPYIFMGKVEMAAPNPLPCVEQKLAKFVQDQPDNSLANYLYAMAILKRQATSPDEQAMQRAEALLAKAVAIDDKFSDAYLQLGVMSASQRDYGKAIGYYSKAIEANPQLGEAHYRMGVAYDRIGEAEKAKQEFQLHDEIKKLEADAIDRQRKEVKQFLVVLPGQPADPPVK
jgi:tetratricopeptide (TPR) repeat protein